MKYITSPSYFFVYTNLVQEIFVFHYGSYFLYFYFLSFRKLGVTHTGGVLQTIQQFTVRCTGLLGDPIAEFIFCW